MKRFSLWVFESNINAFIKSIHFDFSLFNIDENIGLKNIDTTNAIASKEILTAHLNRYYGKKKKTHKDVIDSIRHKFTNYDEEWRKIERQIENIDREIIVKLINPLTKEEKSFDLSEPMDRKDYWNSFVQIVFQIVEFIYESILNPNHHKWYAQANSEWLKSKLN